MIDTPGDPDYVRLVIRRAKSMKGKSGVLLGGVAIFVISILLSHSGFGEEGAPDISLEASQFALLESIPDEHPVFVMTLLQFDREEGIASCRDFVDLTVPHLRQLGGELIFYGEAQRFDIEDQGAHEIFGFRPNPWDALLVTRFPSRRDVRAFCEKEEYQAAVDSLQASVKDAVVYALNGTGYKNIRRSSAETFGPPDFPAEDTLYMLNLLHFKHEGGHEDYVENYGKKAMPLIRKRGGDILFGLHPEQLLIGEEEYERVILVRYPSSDVFAEMMLSDEYQAVAHFREEAIDIGHLYGFSNAFEELKLGEWKE